jgi:hypothetical protein
MVGALLSIASGEDKTGDFYKLFRSEDMKGIATDPTKREVFTCSLQFADDQLGWVKDVLMPAIDKASGSDTASEPTRQRWSPIMRHLWRISSA